MTPDILRVVAYTTAAILCLRAWATERHSASSSRGSHAWVWLVVAAFLVCLATAEWFELGRDVANLGRNEARTDGWYADRRRIQFVTIVAVALGGCLAAVFAVVATPRSFLRYAFPVSVAVALGCFVIIRGISLHSVDALLASIELRGVNLGDLVEVAGAMAIAISAIPMSRSGSRGGSD